MSNKKTGYRGALDAIVDGVGYTIIRIASVAGAIPAMATVLHASGYAVYAWFVIVCVELVGYAIGEVTVRALQKGIINRRQAIWPIGIYAVVIEGMMLGYEVLPAWARWYAGELTSDGAIRSSVAILLPFFTLSGAALLAIKEHIDALVEDEEWTKEIERKRDDINWEDDRAFKLAEREIKLSAKQTQALAKYGAGKVTEIVTETVTPVVETVTASTISQETVTVTPTISQENIPETVGKRIVRHLVAHPNLDGAALAAALGVSKATVSREIKPLLATEVLHSERDGRSLRLSVNGGHEKYLAE